ncbi:MAG TPA: methyltransferase domain-containing protein [bacterium]|jgi:SAM-dependent methyltransferase
MYTDPWEPLSDALMDYHRGDRNAYITVRSDIEDPVRNPINYFFREPDDFPPLEKTAITACRGKILEIGAGAGSHSLALQEMGFDVTAMEISLKACDVMKDRGIRSILNADIFEHQTQKKYDTILMMMNGIGIVGKLNRLPEFLDKIKLALASGGQVIFDSLDLRESISETVIQARYAVPGREYFGEVKYRIEYKGWIGPEYWWLYIDPDKTEEIAGSCGWTIDSIYPYGEGTYLAILSISE